MRQGVPKKAKKKNGIRELDSGMGAGEDRRGGGCWEEATSISGRRMCPKCIMAQPKSATPIAPTTKQREPKKQKEKIKYKKHKVAYQEDMWRVLDTYPAIGLARTFHMCEYTTHTYICINKK